MDQQIEKMRKKWRQNLVGDVNSPIDPHIKKYVDKLSSTGDDLFKKLDKTENRTRLWEKIATENNSGDLATQFEKLANLTKAYGTEGTTVFNNREVLEEIVKALDFLTQSGLYSGLKFFGDWWDWQIGIPQQFTTILMIICDEIDQEKLDKYVDIIFKYVPDPYHQLPVQSQDKLADIKFANNFKNSGANRTGEAISSLALGLFKKDYEMIYTAVNSIEGLLIPVTRYDGFYPDGSFVQHGYVPYTGFYGNYLLKDMGDLLTIVNNTIWEVDEEKLNQYVTNVQNAFVPIVVSDGPMAFLDGRAISRHPLKKLSGPLSKTIHNLLITSELANEKQKRELKQAAKYWIVQDPDYYYENTRSLYDALLIRDVLSDESLDTSTKPFLGSHVYGAMDRFVYSSPDIQLGISMYSNRMSAFEAGNKENLKGWHLSDGMVYLYNSDQQFGDAFWPTVDWYRLPGTTVDTVALHKEWTNFDVFTSSESYVGGVTDGQDAFLSMQLNKKGYRNSGNKTEMDLRAKKSWFVIDGTLISIGTDIYGTTNSSIETIIENRLLDPTSVYTFSDKQGNDVSSKRDFFVKKSDWLLLKSSKANQSIGYFVLDKQTVVTIKEDWTGTYTEINKGSPDDTVYRGTYQKIIINHGKDVSNAQYAYMTYPNANESKLEEISKEFPYKIVANNSEIQAVKYIINQTLGATIWNKKGGTIEGIQVDKPVTLLYKQTPNNQVTLSISNPKHTNESIEVKLPQVITDVVAQDEGIHVKDKYTIVVDTAGGLGKTFQITAILAGEK